MDWEKQYADRSGDFSASWPDQCARQLELNFLEQHWPARAALFEPGCGCLSLCESPDLVGKLKLIPYWGVDISPSAILAARARASWHHIDAALTCCSVFDMKTMPGAWVLSRRLLCNLAPQQRGRMLAQFLYYNHGILIEPTLPGLASLNYVREVNNLPPLPPAQHNNYLTRDEVNQIKCRGATEYRFMGDYYEETRGVEKIGEIDPEQRLKAYQKTKHRAAGSSGPVVAFVW